MFKQSRRKIVASIMGILTLLWIGTLCVIYFSSYAEITSANLAMLEEHADRFVLDQEREVPDRPLRPRPGRDRHWDDDRFQLSTFYSLAFSQDGALLEIRNENETVHTDEDLEKIAGNVLKKKKTSGVYEDLAYYTVDKGEYILVTFMDNTILRGSIHTLFRYTLLFGSGALAALYFLAEYLAKWIVAPLEESYQKQRQFISDAGHELRTPVSVVSANAELLSRELGDNQWLANIQYENERMGRLVNQMLELARTENVEPQMERLDLSRLVDGEVLPFEAIVFEQGLELQAQITQGLQLQGNGTQLKQLVAILLDNAIRHGTGGKAVQITLTREHGHARLSVVNAGEEIPREQREQLFDRFYRGDPSRTGETNHYGLGLAIAKAIVEAHDGKIEVRCYDGLVEFRVTLPLR